MELIGRRVRKIKDGTVVPVGTEGLVIDICEVEDDRFIIVGWEVKGWEMDGCKTVPYFDWKWQDEFEVLVSEAEGDAGLSKDSNLVGE